MKRSNFVIDVKITRTTQRNDKLRRLIGRFQSVMLRSGDMVQNLESPALSGGVDSPAERINTSKTNRVIQWVTLSTLFEQPAGLKQVFPRKNGYRMNDWIRNRIDGFKTQVTGHRSGHRLQVWSGHRSGCRSGRVRSSQGNRKNIFLSTKLTIFAIP